MIVVQHEHLSKANTFTDLLLESRPILTVHAVESKLTPSFPSKTPIREPHVYRQLTMGQSDFMKKARTTHRLDNKSRHD
jgi:hypothetical protein